VSTLGETCEIFTPLNLFYKQLRIAEDSFPVCVEFCDITATMLLRKIEISLDRPFCANLCLKLIKELGALWDIFPILFRFFLFIRFFFIQLSFDFSFLMAYEVGASAGISIWELMVQLIDENEQAIVSFEEKLDIIQHFCFYFPYRYHQVRKLVDFILIHRDIGWLSYFRLQFHENSVTHEYTGHLPLDFLFSTVTKKVEELKAGEKSPYDCYSSSYVAFRNFNRSD
jgi:hypothetical protein